MLSEFETAILQRIAISNAWLRNIVHSLRVSSRKITGGGSYTDFEPRSTSINIPDGHFNLDVLISMPGIPNGMGATLFVKGGNIAFLEVYVFEGDYWDGNFNGYLFSNNA